MTATIITGPFTAEAKMKMLADESRASFEKFFALYAKHRTWDAFNPPELADMGREAELLSDGSKVMQETITLVEARYTHYVEEGLRAAGDNRTVQDLYLTWGGQEMKHGNAFRLACIHAGIHTEKEIDGLIADVLSRKWRFEDQVFGKLKRRNQFDEGRVGTPCEAAFYGKNQEFETGDNYGIHIQNIWMELGAERDEKGRPVYRGLPRLIKHVKIDETYHEGQFTDICRLWLKYFPDKALDAMMTVFSGYTMPLIQVKDPERLLKAVLETGFDSGRKKVMNRGFTDMGLSGFVSLRKALQEVKELSDEALVQLPGSPIIDIVGVPIHEIQPTGELPLAQAA